MALLQNAECTISRLEVCGPVYVPAKKRHGHVELALWNRIVDALEQRGVEPFPEGFRHPGVRERAPVLFLFWGLTDQDCAP